MRVKLPSFGNRWIASDKSYFGPTKSVHCPNQHSGLCGMAHELQVGSNWIGFLQVQEYHMTLFSSNCLLWMCLRFSSLWVWSCLIYSFVGDLNFEVQTDVNFQDFQVVWPGNMVIHAWKTGDESAQKLHTRFMLHHFVSGYFSKKSQRFSEEGQNGKHCPNQLYSTSCI